MKFNTNAIICQITTKGEVKEGKNSKGETYKTQTLEIKVPRQNPKENERTAYDYLKVQVKNELVDHVNKRIELFTWVEMDFVLRSFKTKEGKWYQTIEAETIFTSK